MVWERAVLVVGSRALSTHTTLWRSERDIDLIGYPDEAEDLARGYIQDGWSCVPTAQGRYLILRKPGQKPIEIEMAWPGTSAEQLLQHTPGVQKYWWSAADLRTLYMLKLSHQYVSGPHFNKTRKDLEWFKQQGLTLSSELQEILEQRKKETYNKPLPKLNTSKNEFFNPETYLHYEYDHDSIHRAIAAPLRPAYLEFQPHGAEVWTSRELFEQLPCSVQLRSVLEESYVLALERSQIPFKFAPNRKKSFDMALEKVCTTISSGWWREFAYDNYDIVQSLYDDGYVDKFQAGLQDGTVKEFRHVL
jgi:hypothetical protein